MHSAYRAPVAAFSALAMAAAVVLVQDVRTGGQSVSASERADSDVPFTVLLEPLVDGGSPVVGAAEISRLYGPRAEDGRGAGAPEQQTAVPLVGRTVDGLGQDGSVLLATSDARGARRLGVTQSGGSGPGEVTTAAPGSEVVTAPEERPIGGSGGGGLRARKAAGDGAQPGSPGPGKDEAGKRKGAGSGADRAPKVREPASKPPTPARKPDAKPSKPSKPSKPPKESPPSNPRGASSASSPRTDRGPQARPSDKAESGNGKAKGKHKSGNGKAKGKHKSGNGKAKGKEKAQMQGKSQGQGKAKGKS